MLLQVVYSRINPCLPLCCLFSTLGNVAAPRQIQQNIQATLDHFSPLWTGIQNAAAMNLEIRQPPLTIEGVTMMDSERGGGLHLS
jgi:hypothetical protein